MWRKTFLNDEIKAHSVHGIAWAPLAIGAGTAILGGLMGSKASGDAATAASDSAARNVEFQKWLWGEQQAQTAPYRAAGTAGMDAYMKALGFTWEPGTSGTPAPTQAAPQGIQQYTQAQPAGFQELQPANITSAMTSHEAQAMMAENRRRAAANQTLLSQPELIALQNNIRRKEGLPLIGETVEGERADLKIAASAPIKNRLTSSEEEAWFSPIGLGGPQGSLDNYRARTMRESGIPPAAVDQIMRTGGIGGYGQQPQSQPQSQGTPGRWVAPEDPIADEEFRYGMQDLEMDPGYEFRFQEGKRALQDSAIGGAGLLRGGTMKGMQQYGQEMASQEYGKAYARGFDRYQAKFDRRQQMLNNLYQMATTGANVAVGSGSAASSLGTSVGQSYSDMGNIGAAAAQGKSNAIMGGVGLGLQAYDVFK